MRHNCMFVLLQKNMFLLPWALYVAPAVNGNRPDRQRAGGLKAVRGWCRCLDPTADTKRPLIQLIFT